MEYNQKLIEFEKLIKETYPNLDEMTIQGYIKMVKSNIESKCFANHAKANRLQLYIDGIFTQKQELENLKTREI